MCIPAEVEQKIRVACAACPNLEWSGVLFYDYKGSFEQNNFYVRVRDILVMDIGSAAYTEWCADADVISYMAEHDLLDCQMGIVHSHNTMSTFFSGTDTNTLHDEGQDRNNIVSLIVNNKGEYSAAVTRRNTAVSVVHSEVTYPFFGEGDQSFVDEYETEEVYLEYFMFDIIRKEPKGLFGFIDRLAEIMRKPKPAPAYSWPKANPSALGAPKMGNGYLPGATPVTPKTATTQPVVITVEADPEVDRAVNLSVIQLLTGNVFAANPKFDIKNWVKTSMYKTYSTRFGTETDKKSEFHGWLDNTLEYILYSMVWPDMEDYNANDEASIKAELIRDKLKDMPASNIFLKEIVDSLENYID